jgi:hypothetical protein
MLGIYQLDGINSYLENGILEEIYDLSLFNTPTNNGHFFKHKKYNINSLK